MFPFPLIRFSGYILLLLSHSWASLPCLLRYPICLFLNFFGGLVYVTPIVNSSSGSVSCLFHFLKYFVKNLPWVNASEVSYSILLLFPLTYSLCKFVCKFRCYAYIILDIFYIFTFYIFLYFLFGFMYIYLFITTLFPRSPKFSVT